jgi:transposase-like protein
VRSKKEPFWEATAIDPESRLLISFVTGKRNEALIKELMESTRKRLKSPRDLVVMSDGEKSIDCASSPRSSENPTARRAREGGDASRRAVTESTEASLTSSSSSAVRVAGSWR